MPINVIDEMKDDGQNPIQGGPMPEGTRIQSVIDPSVEEGLQKLATEAGHTLSRYVALALEIHVMQKLVEETCKHREVARLGVADDIHTLRCIRSMHQFETTTDQIRRRGLIVLVPQRKE